MRIFILAIRNLLSHGFRSFLTSLGIIFGIISIIVMMSIGEGARIKSISSIEAMGIDNIILKSVRNTASQAVAEERGILKYGLRETDVKRFIEFDNIRSVVPARKIRKTIYYGSKSYNFSGLAVTEDFSKLLKLRVTMGRDIANFDNEKKKRICVIGKKIKKKIFQFKDPLGLYIRIGLIPYQVVGIIENRYGIKTPFGQNPDEMIFVPLDSYKSDFSFKGLDTSINTVVDVEYDLIYLKVLHTKHIDYTAKRAKRYLEKIHKKNFEVSVPYLLLQQKEETQRTFNIVMVAIAAISLLVGGIGVTNIMTANVFERYKEIGIRRALGAQKIDILVQFLVEAVTISLLGGLFGVLFGVGGSIMVSKIVGWPTAITTTSVLGSFIISVAIGVIFGTYPAWLAAKLDPIKALRSE
ncbi:MAG: hypothetical protein COA79_15135 [Planctomycetota bacterium]|nr:MAG: hypothetical protein COA79_15135 [Planctomycetota bacterium]